MEDLITERQSTSQHLQGRFGTQTNYFITLTWTKRQSISQHLHGRFGTQKYKVLHNNYKEDLVHRKTKYFTTLKWRIWSIQRHTKTEYFTPLTSYMQSLAHRKNRKGLNTYMEGLVQGATRTGAAYALEEEDKISVTNILDLHFLAAINQIKNVQNGIKPHSSQC